MDKKPAELNAHELVNHCFRHPLDSDAWSELETRVRTGTKANQPITAMGKVPNEAFQNMQNSILKQGRRIKELEHMVAKLKVGDESK